MSDERKLDAASCPVTAQELREIAYLLRRQDNYRLYPPKIEAAADWLEQHTTAPAAASEPTRGAEGPDSFCQCGHLDIQHTPYGCNRVIGLVGGIEEVCGCTQFTEIGADLLIPTAKPAAPQSERKVTREQAIELRDFALSIDGFTRKLRELGIEVTE